MIDLLTFSNDAGLISTLDGQLAKEAFDLASSNFSNQSVLHVTLNTDLEEYRAYLRPTFFDDVKDDFSLVAKDTKNDELLGVLIARDLLKNPPISHLPFQRKYVSISKLLKMLETKYLQQRRIFIGDALLVDMAAVSPTHTSRGIYQMLRKEISRRAKLCGYKYVIGELPTAASQKVVLEKMGHRNFAQINLSTFSDDNGRPFKTIVDPETIVLAEEVL